MTPRRALLSDVLWSLVAIGIVAIGLLGFRTLGALRQPIAAVPIERLVPPVEVTALLRHTGSVPVVGEGFVRAQRQVVLATERPGRIVELHPAVNLRGRVSRGDTIARLDDRDAQAMLQRAASDIATTRARLALTSAQLARTRTLRRRGVVSEEALDQSLSLQAELEGTLASLISMQRSAEIALEAMSVLAPFDGRILDQASEAGAVVGAGQAIATLASVDALEVSVALEEAGAALVPDLFDPSSDAVVADTGARATVSVPFAGIVRRYPARVVRVAPALDEFTRTLDVTVRLVDSRAGTPPALINAYATVSIDGEAPPGAQALYAVPDATLRERDALWLAVDGILRIVPVSVVRIEGGTAYVDPGEVPANAALITSVLPAPVDGMAVSVVSADEQLRGDDGSGDAAAALPDSATVR